MAQTTKVFGESVLRKEDDRFLTGRGNFVADMLPPGTVFAKFVRSPYAHARIRSINTAKARRLPGVLDVLTSQDMKDQVGDIITAWAIPNANLKTPAYPPLALEGVRYAGAHTPRHVAKSVRPPSRPFDRAEVSRASDSRDRPGRRWGIRQQDPRLSLGGDRVPPRDATRAAREMGRRPHGELRRDDSRTRPRAVRRPGREEGRDDPRDPGSGPREHGRVPVDRGAGHPDDPLRLHGRRMLCDPGRTRRGDRGLHEHDARRRISRSGSAGAVGRPRAKGRHPRAEAEERSGRHPAEELHSRGQVPVSDRDGPHVRY